jgi:hypothetical protein
MVLIPRAGALPELGHRISDPVILVPGIRIVRIVLPDLGTEGEQVLMHEHRSHGLDIYRAADCFDLCHPGSLHEGLTLAGCVATVRYVYPKRS